MKSLTPVIYHTIHMYYILYSNIILYTSINQITQTSYPLCHAMTKMIKFHPWIFLFVSFSNLSKIEVHILNMSNPTHQGTWGNVLDYSGFILVNRYTLGPYIFVRCHRMLENSGVGLLKFHCIITGVKDFINLEEMIMVYTLKI
jgi:hypothetical protein